ncbi:hypothetical protein Tco_0724220 [Tanacetum coccineum]
MAKKQLALIRQRLNVTTAIGEVTLLENAGHQGIRGIEMEMAKEGITKFALMAYTSQGSSSSSSSNSERDALNKSNLEIIGYQMGLESLEARIVVHEKNEAVYEEDIAFLSQMNKSEVVHSVFNSKESDVDDSPLNDRYKTGNLSFAGLDDSVYKTKVSENKTSISKTSKDIVEKPKTIRPSAPIIEDWDTNSENDSVFRPKTDQTKPKFTKINFVKSDENVKSITVVTKSGQVPINAAKQNSLRAASSISTARLVNTVAPRSKVNDVLPKTYSYFKAHSPVRRAFNQKSTAKINNLNEKVKTAMVNNVTTAGPKAVVSAAVGNGKNVVKSRAGYIWRPTGNVIDHTSKDSGSYMLKRFDYVDLQGRLKQAKRGQDTKIPQSGGPPKKVGDEAVYKELGDRMERAATTASSLEAEQDSGNINRT